MSLVFDCLMQANDLDLGNRGIRRLLRWAGQTLSRLPSDPNNFQELAGGVVGYREFRRAKRRPRDLRGRGMKIQLEQLDLLEPWPLFRLREGYSVMRIVVRRGATPLGEISVRPVRQRAIVPERLRRRIERELGNVFLADKESPAAISWPTPPVTVAVCTRDRAEILERCVDQLRQLDYPDFDILIVDNSLDPVPARQIAERMEVGYVRCSAGGLSRARQTALVHAKSEWVAFIEDDCDPEKSWLKELVRPLEFANCRAVCGLVLPGRLENTAEVLFDRYRGAARRYEAAVFDRGFLHTSLLRAPRTRDIGVGANMLLHRAFAQQVGGLGSGGEETDVFYRILRRRKQIHFAPSAVVHQPKRLSPGSLRKQVYNSAAANAAYHARCFLRFASFRSLLELFCFVPFELTREMRRGLVGRSRYPIALALVELRGTIRGPWQYGAARFRRYWRDRAARKHANGRRFAAAGAPTKVERPVATRARASRIEVAVPRKPPRAA